MSEEMETYEEVLRFPTREDAIQTLELVRNISKLAFGREVSNKIEDIMTCIKMEKDGYHIWGAPLNHVQYINRVIEGDVSTQTLTRIGNIVSGYEFKPSQNDLKRSEEAN